LLAELGRVVTEKFGWEPERAEEAVAQLTRLAEVVDPRKRITEIEADPADNRVLEAAAEGRAEAIVSGDRHLLALKAWRGIAIESLASFIERFAD
jgi:predicted nucleic acid-binding protein